ncbi:MAG: hypothetical protein K940chlam8_01019, partial [Chlamydiae bacterium]|nr:hypothetical protein [Chlamydiota bacterium]
MIKYKKTFILLLTLFLLGLFHEPIVKYSIFKFLKHKIHIAKIGSLEFESIRFSNGTIVLQKVVCFSKQDPNYHFEIEVPQIECILDFSLVKAKFDLQLILHDPEIRLHKKGKDFAKSPLHQLLAQDLLAIKWKGYNVHYKLYDTTGTNHLPSVIEHSIRYIHIDHENKDYKAEFSNFCNGGVFVSLNPIKDRYAIDFRMINVDGVALKKLLSFTELVDVNSLKLSGNLHGHLHLNIGKDGIYVYSGKLKCNDFVFCSSTLNTHLKAKKLSTFLTTKNNRNVMDEDIWQFLTSFVQKVKAKIRVKEGEFLLPIKNQKTTLLTSVQGQLEVGYKHSTFNLEGIYNAFDQNHPFKMKGSITPKNFKQSRMTCQFSFLDSSPILLTCGFDFSLFQNHLIDLDLISFKNSRLDLVFHLLCQNYEPFCDYQLLSNSIGFNLKMHFLKTALKTLQINRFYGLNLKIRNVAKDLSFDAKKCKSVLTFDAQKKHLVYGKFDVDTFRMTFENKVIFENLHAKMEIENSELKKLFCHSHSDNTELQLEVGGKNKIGTFSYKGPLNKLPAFKFFPLYLPPEKNEILIQASLSKLGPYLKLLGGVDFSNSEKDARIDFAFDLKDVLKEGNLN